MSTSAARQIIFESQIRALLERYSTTLPVAILTLPVAFYVLFALVEPLKERYAFDLAINYSAATILRTGSSSIYDRNALERVHKERIGSVIPYDVAYKGLFTTYINPPTTAILFLPLSLFPFWLARIVFLILNNILYLGSIYLMTRILNVSWKTLEGILIWICALTFYPFVFPSNWRTTYFSRRLCRACEYVQNYPNRGARLFSRAEKMDDITRSIFYRCVTIDFSNHNRRTRVDYRICKGFFTFGKYGERLFRESKPIGSDLSFYRSAG
jgi:hypothetical protein